MKKPQGLMLPDGVSKYGDTIYMRIDSMDFKDTRNIFLALQEWNWKTVKIDLLSSGGSLFGAMGMVSIFRELQAQGKIVEIKAQGIVASAAVLVFLAGTPGHRFIDKYAMLMLHELWTFKFFAIETPSDKEEEARIFRKIQDKINHYICEHSKISKEELNQKTQKKELWLDAEEAVKYGLADKIWGESKAVPVATK